MQEDLARVAQHHDEGHQRTAGATDRDMPEVSPVHLRLLARQAAQAQIRLGRPRRAMAGDEVTEVLRATTVAALAHHGEETAGGERGEFLQRLAQERQVRINQRAARWRPGSGQAGLGQHPHHGGMVHMQLAGDGADAPFLDVIIAQDLRLQLRRDGHGVLLDVWPQLEPSPRRRRKPVRTNGGQRRPHQWQHQNGGP